jgi:hypothetical protein
MLIPSSAVESMGMGGLMGAAALRQSTLTGDHTVVEIPGRSGRTMLAKLFVAGMLMLSMTASGRAQNVPPSQAIPLDLYAAIRRCVPYAQRRARFREAGHGERMGLHFFALTDPQSETHFRPERHRHRNGSATVSRSRGPFVAREPVSREALRQIWRNTVLAGSHPTVRVLEVFNAVREVNATLPNARQLRVLLGDPPIEWNTSMSADDHRRWVEMREYFPAD